MIVSYPFTLRKDNFETKTYEEGTKEAKMSELAMFFDTEENEVPFEPEYGVRKRDLLFSTEIDEAMIGLILARWQEKVDMYFDDVILKDLYIEDTDKKSTKVFRLIIEYGGEETEVEVKV